MADGLLPPDGTDKSIDPEVLSSAIQPSRPKIWEIPGVRKAAVFISVATLFTFLCWLLSNFLQLRGVVDLTASRIDLGFMWLTATALVWVLTSAAEKKKVIRWIAPMVLLIGVYGLDEWAPKPQKVIPGQISVEAKKEIFQLRYSAMAAKDRFLESPEYRKQMEAMRELRSLVSRIEEKHNCVIEDSVNLVCYSDPPARIVGSNLSIKVMEAFLSGGKEPRFWLLHGMYRSPGPLALKLDMSNNGDIPIKVDHIALEYLSPNGWKQLRRVGTLGLDTNLGSGKIVFERPQYLASGYAVAGGNLFPRIYEDQIAPHHAVGGWTLAEIPSGLTSPNSLGAVRISVLANGEWMARSSSEPRTLRAHEEPDLDNSKQAQVIEGSIVIE